jgi:hypothetical protein
VWGKISEQDSYADDGLVAVRPRAKTDRFTAFAQETVTDAMYWFNVILHPYQEITSTTGFYDNTIPTTMFWIMSFVAASVPVIAVNIFVNVDTLTGGLLTIAGFSGLMSFCLFWLTDPSRVEAFAIIAL